MSFRFRKRIKIAPGLHINLSKGWPSLSIRGHGATSPGSVAATTIPEILRQSSADKIDLLKLDIEGAELELFSCGSDVWLGHVRLLVLELHDRFRPGCAQALYTAANGRPFTQEIRGETLFIRFRESCSSPPLKKNCEPVAQ